MNMIRVTVTYENEFQVRTVRLFGILIYQSRKEWCSDVHRYF